ncbi:MAG TPA: ketopantoate reductase family protein [Acidobacteriota bacterium]|nr:ketopantoate reductase family protein [Acidobacteriota bacterium]
MRVLIFGAGAMSCLFGARLAPCADVTLVDTWREGIDAIRERGILLEEQNGLRVAAVDAAYLGAPLASCELAFVLVKSWQTGLISKYLSGYLAAGGIAISLQNGLGNVEKLGHSAYPGSTSEGATLLGPGHVRAGGPGPTYVVAPDWVVELLKSAGFEAYACDSPKAASLLWGKLSVSCGINALTALLRVSNGELLRIPAAIGLMERAVLECSSVAQAAGIELPFADPVLHTKQIAERTAANKSSMLQDVLRGAPTECDAINGAVVREGTRLGIPTPVNENLWQLVLAAGP